jgi:hypothetical protein
MADVFSLWETASGNIINTYDTEAQALAVVRATIAEHGWQAVATLALARETSRSVKQIAEGESLAERALAADSARTSTAPGKSAAQGTPLPV